LAAAVNQKQENIFIYFLNKTNKKMEIISASGMKWPKSAFLN